MVPLSWTDHLGTLMLCPQLLSAGPGHSSSALVLPVSTQTRADILQTQVSLTKCLWDIAVRLSEGLSDILHNHSFLQGKAYRAQMEKLRV